MSHVKRSQSLQTGTVKLVCVGKQDPGAICTSRYGLDEQYNNTYSSMTIILSQNVGYGEKKFIIYQRIPHPSDTKTDPL